MADCAESLAFMVENDDIWIKKEFSCIVMPGQYFFWKGKSGEKNFHGLKPY